MATVIGRKKVLMTAARLVVKKQHSVRFWEEVMPANDVQKDAISSLYEQINGIEELLKALGYNYNLFPSEHDCWIEALVAADREAREAA